MRFFTNQLYRKCSAFLSVFDGVCRCCEEPILYLVVGASPWTIFVVSVLICVIAGSLSWILVEQPFLRLKSKRKARGGNPEAISQTQVLTDSDLYQVVPSGTKLNKGRGC